MCILTLKSGLKIEVDLSKHRGQRVISIRARSHLKNEKDEYEILDLKKYYTVIMNEYMWEGGDGFTFKKNYAFHSFGK